MSRQKRRQGASSGWTPVRVWRAAPRSRRRGHPHRWLRLGLVLGGLAVLASSAGALAFGGQRIIAEEAAFRGPAAPQCVPSTLDRSDVLPGTSLRVSPLPDSLDATPHTQISLLGVPVGQLQQVTVSGSVTGAHDGHLVGFSQADGASFLPTHAFLPGEIVTVRGKIVAGKRTQPFAFHFTISVPDPIPWEPPGHESEGKPGEVQHYHSAPALNSPSIQVDAGASSAGGDIFSAPYSGPGGDGPMITEPDGQLVWFDPLPHGTYATNLQVQSYDGQPVLTWWQGHIPKQGFGEGEEVIANSSYAQIGRVRAGNGLKADLHDFKLGANETALMTVFNPIRCNLTAIHGPQDGAVNDSVFQEVDLRTGLVRRQWDSLDHIALTDSYSTPYGASDEWPYDYFHMNSLDEEPEGEMLISARNTWALYELNEQTGQVSAEAGGKHSTIKMGSGTLTAFQHDATLQPDGLISIFDNGGVPTVHPQSRGIVVALNLKAGTETLVSEFEHPGAALKA
ncbi:MAG TPA: arylsulfotransferase family protein, partial [Solirubrobacteraceae bacterium]|nr:arylsulfotransferase family protein [Solirubrobacteraceae bacterium]